MKIVEILQNANGSHSNQLFEDHMDIPQGWAVIPDTLETPNFPFGEIEVSEVNGIMTVTKWIPLPIPKPEPQQNQPTELDQLRADIDYIAMVQGVEL